MSMKMLLQGLRMLTRPLVPFAIGALGPPVGERAAQEEDTAVAYRENQLAAHDQNHRARHRESSLCPTACSYGNT